MSKLEAFYNTMNEHEKDIYLTLLSTGATPEYAMWYIEMERKEWEDEKSCA